MQVGWCVAVGGELWRVAEFTAVESGLDEVLALLHALCQSFAHIAVGGGCLGVLNNALD
jgi:hypothetical protein